MRVGVHGCFLKDKLSPRLIAAIERETREAAIRVERKKMQEQPIISDRMVPIDTFAAGVEHEIDNPLVSVTANLDLAAQDVAVCAAKTDLSTEFNHAQEELDDARAAAERIRNIGRDPKIFSRSDEGKKGALDVQRVMESTNRRAAFRTG